MTEDNQTQNASPPPRPPLNLLNYLNVLFYVLNFAFTYGVGTMGLLGNPDNGELSRKYQTIITPKSTAFSIWALIFILQLIFVIIQLLPRFRANDMVQSGVGYYYLLTCFFQIAWTFAFAYEVNELALVFIVSIWLSLVALLYSQYYTKSDNTLVEFWLLRFPFALHCGWLTAASLLNVNVVVVDHEAPADVQLALGIVSLAVLHAVAVWVLFVLDKHPNYTIACVLAWANGWIYAELKQPQQIIVDTFSQEIISSVSYAAISVCVIIVVQMVVKAILQLIEKYFPRQVESSSSSSSSNPIKVDAADDSHEGDSKTYVPDESNV